MRKILNMLLIMAVMASVASCVTNETWEDTPSPSKEGEAQVVLRLRTPESFTKSGTRALTHEQETTLDDIYVLVFNNSNNLTRIVQGKDVQSTAGTGIGSFVVTLAASTAPSDTYKLVVLANASSILGSAIGFEASAVTNKGYADVIKLINDEIIGKMYPSGGKIPMWGETAQIVIQSGVTPPQVSLARAICRIDVGIGSVSYDDVNHIYSWNGKDAQDNVIPFELTSVHVVRPNNKYAVVQGLAERTSDAPTIPAGTTAFTVTESVNLFGYEGLPGHTQRSIYVPEADILMGPGGKSGDTNHTERMAIVVGGKYNGQTTPTYYRVDFAQNGSLINAVRNHLYQFNIKGVTGEGFPDVPTAYESVSVNMTVQVLEWKVTEIGFVVFDGKNYLGVSPTEFNLYKEKSIGNKFTVRTDVLPDGWKIDKVIEETPTGGVPAGWITDITPTFGNIKDQLYPVTFTVEENNSGAVRTAWIHIRAGRLDYAVKVVQDVNPKLEDYAIVITDAQGMEVNELLFIGEASQIPVAQTFNVQWTPSSKSLDSRLVPASNYPLAATYTPTMLPNVTNNLTWVPNGITYAVAPSPIGTAPTGNDFFEKTARVHFEMQTPLGPVTKILNLRQSNYNLVLRAEPVLMDGNPHTFHVRANFTWKVEFESASSPDAPSFTGDQIVKPFVTQYGGNNTAAGDPVTFSCYDFFTNYSSGNPKTAVVKFKFFRLDENGQWVVFGTRDINCYAAAPVGGANCYMIDNANPVPILIPVSHISKALSTGSTQEAMKLPRDWMPSDCKNLKAAVLWSDINTFGDAGVVKTVEYNGAANYADGKIVVVPGTGTGNAVVILYADNNSNGSYQKNTDKIYWSWHIWKSSYFPYRNGSYPGLNPEGQASGNGGRWMDRNLGATANSSSDFIHSVGLYYQWGRKDPHPRPDGTSTSIAFSNVIRYFPPGSDVNYTQESFTNTSNNLVNATTNPLTHYHTIAFPHDWYMSGDLTSYPHANIWGGASLDAAKSVYDPCPEGYRVPKRGEWSTSAWTNTTRGVNNPYHGGYYPKAGYRTYTNTVEFTTHGYYYQSSMWSTNPDYSHKLYLWGTVGESDPNSYNVRSYETNIRCVKDNL